MFSSDSPLQPMVQRVVGRRPAFAPMALDEARQLVRARSVEHAHAMRGGEQPDIAAPALGKKMARIAHVHAIDAARSIARRPYEGSRQVEGDGSHQIPQIVPALGGKLTCWRSATTLLQSRYSNDIPSIEPLWPFLTLVRRYDLQCNELF